MVHITPMSEEMKKRMGQSVPRDIEGGDFFPTHRVAIEALIDFEKFPKRILEPACGGGSISRILENRGYTVESSDLFDHGYGLTGRNFLTHPYKKVPAIITNPPFYKGMPEAFIKRSLELATHKVALFSRLVWISGHTNRRQLMNRLKISRILVCGRVKMGPKQGMMVDYC